MKLAMRRAAPCIMAVAVAGTALALLPDEDGGRTAARRPHVAAPEPVAKAYVGDPENPATWKLPIEAYMPTKAEVRLMSSSRDDAIKACMARAGFRDWQPAPDLPTVGGTTLTDWRYGIHDVAQAKEFGYHPDPAQQEAYEAALDSDKSMNTDTGTLEGCASQAGGESDIPQSALVDQISGDAYKQSAQATTVTQVFAQWSACMKSKGYSYAKPMDASDDTKFASGPDEISAAEKATASADIACRDQFHVEKTWFDAESLLQQKAIAEHLDELNQQNTAIKSAVSKARYQ